MQEIRDIVQGCLLGDGSIRAQNNKYFSFKVTSKDKMFAEWIKNLFNNFQVKCWISEDNKSLFSVWFYINSCPYSEFLSLRKKWYKKLNGKIIKTVPRDLQLNQNTLLFWYLGDGSLIKRKNDFNRVPYIVLATNTFLWKDIKFLIQKLKEINLSFYPVKYKSGFTKKECGYCLYSNTQDGTPYRFFKIIGLECPKEISNFKTGKKGIYKKEKTFKDKWPTQKDWIKILSNVREIGSVLRKRRLELGLSQNQLAKKIGIRRENIRDVELGKRNFGVENLRKVLNALKINPKYLLEKMNENEGKI
jgi:DNA-binding XRE family transcriptional regulator